MVAKIFFVVCLQAVIMQSISAQNCGCRQTSQSSSCSNSNSNSYYGFSKTATATTGGPLTVTCYGPLSTDGVSVLAELGMEGQVQVTGSMPFLSAVSLEGILPTSGSASVDYGCGNGDIVIVQESGNPSGNNAVSTSGLTLAQLGGCRCRN
ncbi:chorion class B protein PC10-like [Choristoneura fumiferana]|uniref:chorion class B protein PC10-like n=1 Tax=Choristoneura fumiferana TaxID=7141 RepID=UPI003D15485E